MLLRKLGLGLTFAGAVAWPQVVAAHEKWITISVGRYFSFEAPPETSLCPDAGKGIDSVVEEYCGSDFRLGFDYGPYSNNLSELIQRSGYTSDHVNVDGRDALVVTGPGKNAWGCRDIVTAVYLVVSNGSSAEKTKLEMHGCTSKAEAIENLHRVFQSLKFNA